MTRCQEHAVSTTIRGQAPMARAASAACDTGQETLRTAPGAPEEHRDKQADQGARTGHARPSEVEGCILSDAEGRCGKTLHPRPFDFGLAASTVMPLRGSQGGQAFCFLRRPLAPWPAAWAGRVLEGFRAEPRRRTLGEDSLPPQHPERERGPQGRVPRRSSS